MSEIRVLETKTREDAWFEIHQRAGMQESAIAGGYQRREQG